MEYFYDWLYEEERISKSEYDSWDYQKFIGYMFEYLFDAHYTINKIFTKEQRKNIGTIMTSYDMFTILAKKIEEYNS